VKERLSRIEEQLNTILALLQPSSTVLASRYIRS
jgi:hypothetical protein